MEFRFNVQFSCLNRPRILLEPGAIFCIVPLIHHEVAPEGKLLHISDAVQGAWAISLMGQRRKQAKAPGPALRRSNRLSGSRIREAFRSDSAVRSRALTWVEPRSAIRDLLSSWALKYRSELPAATARGAQGADLPIMPRRGRDPSRRCIASARRGSAGAGRCARPACRAVRRASRAVRDRDRQRSCCQCRSGTAACRG